MRENNRRSIIKSISWRFIATSTTIIVVFLFTGELVLSLGVGFVEATSKIVFYYIHERLWDKISWGRI